MRSTAAHTLQAVGLAMLLVGAGIAIGIAAERTWLAEAATAPSPHRPDHPHPRHRPGPPRGDFPHHILEMFQTRLALTDEQSVEIEAILRGVHTRARALHETMEPKMRAIVEGSDDAIRAVLTEQQRAEYEDIVRERNARFRHRLGPP